MIKKLIKKYKVKEVAILWIILEFAAALLVVGIARSAAQTEETTTVYHNATLIDPMHQEVVENAYIVVTGGKISSIGQGQPEQVSNRDYQDMEGAYALPGFFDAHGHITAGPLTVSVENGVAVADMSSRDPLTQYNALLALAYGVTTIRSPAGDPVANQHYSQQVENGEWLGPEALHAGFTFDPTPIKGGSVYPTTEQEWREEVARQKALGTQYIKLYTGLTEEEVALGIEIAHEQGMGTIAHLDQVSWLSAIEYGIDALTHALPTSADLLVGEAKQGYEQSRSPISSKFMYQWFELADYNSQPVQALVKQLAEKQVLVDLTLSVNDITYFFDEADTRFPEAFLEQLHPEQTRDWHSHMEASHYGWTEEDYQRAHTVFPKVLAFAKLLHDNHVPMLIGTDGYGGGPSYPHELMLHAQAGISNWDVLALATHLSAERLGLGERTGSLQEGMEADIVFLNSNPLQDISNTGDVHTTVVDGAAYRADQLLDMAQVIANDG